MILSYIRDRFVISLKRKIYILSTVAIILIIVNQILLFGRICNLPHNDTQEDTDDIYERKLSDELLSKLITTRGEQHSLIKKALLARIREDTETDGEFPDLNATTDARNDSSVFWSADNFKKNAQLLELQENLVPNIVYFVWCGYDEDKVFEFNHYLSVKSAWMFLRPDVIEIFYDHLPKQNSYHAWLDELITSIPVLSLHHTGTTTFPRCGLLYALGIISERGGIFVSWGTVLTDTVSRYRTTNFTLLSDKGRNSTVVFSQINSGNNITAYREVLVNQMSIDQFKINTRCAIVRDLNSTSLENADCFVLKKALIPVNIMTVRSDVGNILRFLYYGVTQPVSARVDKSTPIPKIIHYVWYNEETMTHVMYLSVLSSLYIVKADKIYIHGDNLLHGAYFEKIKAIPRVVIVYREIPFYIYGTMVRYRHHKSDVIRAEVLLKYGGVYVDWDVIWLKPIDDLLSAGYDVILNYDHTPRDFFPDSINMGVVMAKPEAKYIKLWQNTYKNYLNDNFAHNPVLMPYKVFEKYPWLVHVEKHLQVMCLHLQCHPVFHPDYKKIHSAQPFNWETDTYAIHFTFPNPPELIYEKQVRVAKGMFAEIGRKVLKAAGEL